MKEIDIQKLKLDILRKCTDLNYNISFIKKGMVEAEELHKDHLRKSGEPYIIHPFSVALEIANLNISQDAVVAAFLHDTIEDCGVDKKYIQDKFNPTVAELVEGVTKLDDIADNSISRYTEFMNLRKFLISSSSDVRVLLIKLADRLHNMRTIDALPPQKQIDYSDETLKVYVPLAEYIGIGKFKRELEDIAFRKKDPVLYQKIKYKVEHDERIHSKLAEQLVKDLQKILGKHPEIHVDTVFGRIKSVTSIHNKFKKQLREGKIIDADEMNMSKIKDFIGVSIILGSNEIDCYKVLGIIHSQFEFSSKDFDDYIAKPKSNGYRALQTTVYYKNTTAEIQIKTKEMHEVNEFGPASHIAYKTSGNRNTKATTKFSWIKNLSLWSSSKKHHNDNEKYTINAFSDRIFVITPMGKVIDLSKGSTPIDFAYAIHSEVGNRFQGVKINGVIGKIDAKLQNGDVVEIITSKNTKIPSSEWIKSAFSTTTRQKIKKFLHIHERESNIQKGKDQIADYLNKAIKIDWFTLDSGILRFLCTEFGCKDMDSFYLKIFHENLSKKDILKTIVRKLNIQQDVATESETKGTEAPKRDSGSLVIEGVEDLDYKLAGCCNPKVGNNIVGIVTLKDGLKIHKANCPNLNDISEQRILKAEWG